MSGAAVNAVVCAPLGIERRALSRPGSPLRVVRTGMGPDRAAATAARLTGAGALLVAPAREAAYRHVVPGLGANTNIRIARHGPRAGVLGAALLAAQEYAEAQGEKLDTVAGEAAT